DLMAEAATAAVEHDDDLVRDVDTHRLGRGRIEDAVWSYNLNLEVMVPRAERANLLAAALQGPCADLVSVRSRHRAALLRPFQVLGPPIPVLDAPTGAVLGDGAELTIAELQKAARPDARRHTLIQRIDQLADAVANLCEGEIGTHQTHAAVDIE